MSFPGGMRDDTDVDEVDTALREAEEEIGLPRQDVTVIGQLLPRFNLRMTLITPVLGIVNPSFTPLPNQEVDKLLSLL